MYCPQCLNSKNTRGYYLVLVASAMYALIHVVAKPILEVEEGQLMISPVVMAFMIYIMTGLFFTPLARKTRPISKTTRKDVAIMFLIGLAEVSALITYFFGLKDTSAVNASIFSNGEIIFSLVIALIVFKEKLNNKEKIPFTMIIMGLMVIPVGNDLYENDMSIEGVVTGDILILLSGLLYAIDITLCKYVGDKYDSKRITQMVSYFCAGVALVIALALQIPFNVEAYHIPSLVVLAIFGTGISTLFFLIGLKLIGAVRTVLLYSTTSVFGIIFSALILSEAVGVIDIISSSIVLLGIFFLRNKLAEGESNEKIGASNSYNWKEFFRIRMLQKITNPR